MISLLRAAIPLARSALATAHAVPLVIHYAYIDRDPYVIEDSPSGAVVRTCSACSSSAEMFASISDCSDEVLHATIVSLAWVRSDAREEIEIITIGSDQLHLVLARLESLEL